MHDQLRHDMEQAIEGMSDAEKLELIEKLAHSLRVHTNGPAQNNLTPEQKGRLLESISRISSLPLEGPGGFSGRDHDDVLYGPQERPAR